MLRDLAEPGRDQHLFIKPLQEALGANWGPFRRSGLGRRLDAARTPQLQAQERLAQMMRRGDPLAGLQHQLARLFAPAPIMVYGEIVPAEPEQGGELDAIAYRVALIGLGQQIAEKVYRCLPPGRRALGALQRLRLNVSPQADGRCTCIEVVQVPFHKGPDDRFNAELSAAAKLAGGSAFTAEDRFSVSVSSTLFW